MRISDEFGLTGPFPFLDVFVEKDNLLFLDPSAIRIGTSKYSVAADRLLVAFFTELLRLRLSTSNADHAKGLVLLRHLHEPNETRLGMSIKSKFGRAFGDEESRELWDLLGRSHEAKIAVLTRLEHLRLFADGVGYDLISDATTRIIFHELVAFTTAMMATYPSLSSRTVTEDFDLFDPSSLSWGKRQFTLPVADGRPLLLVPKEWVYWRAVMDVAPFYNRYATKTLQRDKVEVLANGKEYVPSKKQLIKDYPDKRDLNRAQATKYKEKHGRNLVEEYQKAVDSEFAPLTDDELRARIGA